VVIQIAALFVFNLMNVMKSNFNVKDAALDFQVCDSNASWHSYNTRNDSTISMWCTVSGLSMVINSFVNYWCCLALAIEIWLRVVWNLKVIQSLIHTLMAVCIK